MNGAHGTSDDDAKDIITRVYQKQSAIMIAGDRYTAERLSGGRRTKICSTRYVTDAEARSALGTEVE
jgi:hypothetical protein